MTGGLESFGTYACGISSSPARLRGEEQEAAFVRNAQKKARIFGFLKIVNNQ